MSVGASQLNQRFDLLLPDHIGGYYTHSGSGAVSGFAFVPSGIPDFATSGILPPRQGVDLASVNAVVFDLYLDPGQLANASFISVVGVLYVEKVAVATAQLAPRRAVTSPGGNSYVFEMVGVAQVVTPFALLTSDTVSFEAQGTANTGGSPWGIFMVTPSYPASTPYGLQSKVTLIAEVGLERG